LTRGLGTIAMPLLLLAACATGGGPVPEPGEEPPAYEHYLRNPTWIEADSAYLILPARYEPHLVLKGLSEGWRTEGDRKLWEGTGEAELGLHRLVVKAGRIRVTLVPGRREPEVIVRARGDVAFAVRERGVLSTRKGLGFVWLRNDEWLEAPWN